MSDVNEPYAKNQLLVLPDGTLGRYQHIVEAYYEPRDLNRGLEADEYMVIAVKNNDGVNYYEITDVTMADEYPSAEEFSVTNR